MPWPRHFGECGRCPIHSCFMCFAIFPPNSASGRWRNESAPVGDGISGAGPGCVSPSMLPIAFFRVIFPKNRPIPASCGGVQAETRRDYTRRGRDFSRHGQAGVLSSHDCSPIHCGIREGHGGNISGHDLCCPQNCPQKWWISSHLTRPWWRTCSGKNEVPQGFLHLAGLRCTGIWWAHQDSNLGPAGYEPEALPTEL